MSKPDSSYPREANGLAMKGPMLPTRVEAAANACEVEDNKRVVVRLREIDILFCLMASCGNTLCWHMGD